MIASLTLICICFLVNLTNGQATIKLSFVDTSIHNKLDYILATLENKVCKQTVTDFCSATQFPLCQNGGTCTNRRNGFSCACASGFTGHLCQVKPPRNFCHYCKPPGCESQTQLSKEPIQPCAYGCFMLKNGTTYSRGCMENLRTVYTKLKSVTPALNATTCFSEALAGNILEGTDSPNFVCICSGNLCNDLQFTTLEASKPANRFKQQTCICDKFTNSSCNTFKCFPDLLQLKCNCETCKC